MLAGAVGMGSIVIIGISSKKVKKYKAEIRELRTAVIAHEKHIYKDLIMQNNWPLKQVKLKMLKNKLK
ncbi:hypothetical protein [Spiroplasma endosymbiont of Polydrusus formosus]|uniref:hypothetical protein n=1 Tax=Spiroplasma endosymbiont of Polydrusus formosus TaxID=3139326 RepID=UPI0035B5316C